LAVSRSGYYAWRDRALSARAVADQQLLALQRQIHRETREEYGAIKLWREARQRGIRCGRHRVARLRQRNPHLPESAALHIRWRDLIHESNGSAA